jgi:hypothetical protein
MVGVAVEDSGFTRFRNREGNTVGVASVGYFTTALTPLVITVSKLPSANF